MPIRALVACAVQPNGRDPRGGGLEDWMFGSAFCVARVLGIRICVDWGLLLLLALLTVNLGVGLLPTWHPEWGIALSVAVGLVAALSFLASILVHELSHAVVGRALGIRINSITLFIFGGAANMEDEPPSAKSEFLMAGVGPVASLVIGIGCLALSYPALRDALATEGGNMFAGLGPAETILLWLGPTNVVLALFNLVPAFPLDGGRLLRSVLWQGTGSLDRATTVAALVGRAFAWGLMGLGAAMLLGVRVPYLGGGVGQGIWLGLIGWFLDSAAAQSHERQRALTLLDRRQVAQLMRAEVAGVAPDVSLEALATRFFTTTRQPVFPVLLGELVVGIVTAEEVRKLPRGQWLTTRVRDVMRLRSEFGTIGLAESAAGALRKLQDAELPALPVIEAAQLRGLVYHADLVRYVDEELGRGPRARRPRQVEAAEDRAPGP